MNYTWPSNYNNYTQWTMCSVLFPMLWDFFFKSGTLQSPMDSSQVPWTIRGALLHFSKYSQVLWMWGAICYHQQQVIPFWISVWICEAAKLTHILLFTCSKGIISLEKFLQKWRWCLNIATLNSDHISLLCNVSPCMLHNHHHHDNKTGIGNYTSQTKPN